MRVARIVGSVSLTSLSITLLVLQILAVRTETVNWDEFGLLSRAHESLRTGQLQGGGRPGLASILAMPAAVGCTNGVSAVQKARYAWLLFTTLLVAGLWMLLRRICRRSADPALAATLGAGLLVLVPVFLRWSLQARADQPALAASVWSGVLLLGERRRWEQALAAGCLLGAGYLLSQKALYIGLLLLVLVVGDLFIDGEWRTRRELGRAVAFAGGALLALAAFRILVSRLFSLPPIDTWNRVTSAFPGYRATIGYRAYVGMIPTLVPHAVLLVFLAYSTWREKELRESAGGRHLIVAWGVMILAVAVGAFHAGAFPYFWMTLGIFPAVSFALGFEKILQLMNTPRDRFGLVALIGILLAIPTLRASLKLQEDSQAAQRSALSFVDRNFAPQDRGFQPESALFCRMDPAPFPTFFSQDIAATFYRAYGPERTAEFMEEFRKRPVKFIMSSFRLQQFPPAVRQFWSLNYVPYRDNVLVPARELSGAGEASISFDILVSGRYRWWPESRAKAESVVIDDRLVAPRDSVFLESGAHAATLGKKNRGWLVLALHDPPSEGPFLPFYGLAMIRENNGIRVGE